MAGSRKSHDKLRYFLLEKGAWHKPDAEVARITGFSVKAIVRQRKRLGLMKPNARANRYAVLRDFITGNWREMSDKEIGDRFSVARTVVAKLRASMGMMKSWKKEESLRMAYENDIFRKKSEEDELDSKERVFKL